MLAAAQHFGRCHPALIARDPTQVLDVELTLNGGEVFEEAFSIKKLEKTCVGIPYVKKFAKVCLDFDHVVLNTTYVHACASGELDLVDKKLATVDLGCFGFHL